MADVKPDLSTPLSIKLKAADSEAIVFKIKPTTRMAKVKSAYAAKLGQPVGNFKFLWNGTRVEDDHTPASLELEEDDQLDVMLEMTGG